MNESIINASLSPQIVTSGSVSSLSPPFLDTIPVVGPIISKVINFIGGLGDSFLGISGNKPAEYFFIFAVFVFAFIIVKKVIFK